MPGVPFAITRIDEVWFVTFYRLTEFCFISWAKLFYFAQQQALFTLSKIVVPQLRNAKFFLIFYVSFYLAKTLARENDLQYKPFFKYQT